MLTGGGDHDFPEDCEARGIGARFLFGRKWAAIPSVQVDRPNIVRSFPGELFRHGRRNRDSGGARVRSVVDRFVCLTLLLPPRLAWAFPGAPIAPVSFFKPFRQSTAVNRIAAS